jgi:hypothetical protein
VHLEEAVVTAYLRGALGASAAARTGADGRFRIDGLAAGNWTLVANRNLSAPAVMDAAVGATGVRLRLASGGSVRGRVIDRATGAAITAFTVVARSVAFETACFVHSDGRYALEHLTPGDAVLRVVAPGYAPSAEVRVTVPSGGAPATAADFELLPAARVQGVVLSRGGRKPIVGANVTAESAPGEFGVPVRSAASTSDDGRFELAEMFDGPATLFASAPGHRARSFAVGPEMSGKAGGPIEIALTPLARGEEARIELAGTGILRGKIGEALRVLDVVPRSGAADAGLERGDEIVAIEGAAVSRMSIREAMPLLRGPQGTKVTVTFVKAADSARTPLTAGVERRHLGGRK